MPRSALWSEFDPNFSFLQIPANMDILKSKLDVILFNIFSFIIGALGREYRWKILLAPESKSNTLPLGFFRSLTTKPLEILRVL